MCPLSSFLQDKEFFSLQAPEARNSKWQDPNANHPLVAPLGLGYSRVRLVRQLPVNSFPQDRYPLFLKVCLNTTLLQRKTYIRIWFY